jgi:hypothetical protein
MSGKNYKSPAVEMEKINTDYQPNTTEQLGPRSSNIVVAF